MRVAIVCGAAALLSACASGSPSTTSPAATSGGTVVSTPATGSAASTSTSSTTVTSTTVVTVNPAQAAIEAGASIGRQWTPTGPVAWVVMPVGAPDAPQEQRDEFPAGTAVISDAALPASVATSAFELAVAAGRPVVGLGAQTATDDGELAALSGLVGSTDPVVWCESAAIPADVVCASLLGVVNAGRLVGYNVLDHGVAIGDADVVYDSTGEWRIASWSVAADAESPPIVLPSTTWNGAYVDEPAGGPLRIGDKGGRVTAVQKALGDLGLIDPPFDGFFGPATEQAVIALQMSQGIAADGVAGSAVFAALKLSYAEPSPATPESGFALRGHGIGSINFGASKPDATPMLDLEFGRPEIQSYSLHSMDGGGYSVSLGDPQDLGNALTFAYPELEIRCYTNGLCVNLGGATPAALLLVGWTYGTSNASTGSAPMYTLDGVTIGSTTTAFAGIVRRTGAGCFSSQGVADLAGTISVDFDDSWPQFDDPIEPAPGESLAIVYMSAGQLTGYGDGCS